MKKLFFLIILCLPFVLHSQVPGNEICGNGIDDDNNGLIDCEDPGCSDIESNCVRPIPCIAETILYQVSNTQDNPNVSQFTEYDTELETFEVLNDNMGRNLNAIGYNSEDGFIYGFDRSDNLCRIGVDGADGTFGAVVSLGTIGNLPSTVNTTVNGVDDAYYIGSFDDSGNLFVMSISSANSGRMYSIDVSEVSPGSTVNAEVFDFVGSDLGISDMVFFEGDFYFIKGENSNSETSELYSINSGINDDGDLMYRLSNPTILANTPACINWGSAFSSTGSLYFFCNQSSQLYAVNLDNSTSQSIVTVNNNITGSDGASCPASNGLSITSYCCDSPNLLTNGNFEDGFSGFQNYYTPVDVSGNGNVGINRYDVTDNIPNVRDHSACTVGSINSNYLAINGNGVSTRTIWETVTPIDVNSGDNYRFCAYLKSLSGNPIEVRMDVRHWNTWVHGTWVTVNTGIDQCDWQEVGAYFTAKSPNMDVRIRIKGVGNDTGLDVAMDDVSFMNAGEAIDPYVSIGQGTMTNPNDPDGPRLLTVTASLDSPSALPSGCDYSWAIVEVNDLDPLDEDWAQTIDNGWHGGSDGSGHPWGLVNEDFSEVSGESLLIDRTYRLYFTVLCGECSPVIQLYHTIGYEQNFRKSNLDCLKEEGFQAVEVGSEAYNYLMLLANTKGNPSPLDIASLPKNPKKVVLDCAGSASDETSVRGDKSDIRISPNPFGSSFSVEFPSSDDMPLEMRVITMQGVEVYSDLDLRTTEQINLGGLPTGVYLLTIKYEDRIETRKIIKDKENGFQGK